MLTQKHTKMYFWLRTMTILLIVGLLLPSGAALAQDPAPTSRQTAAIQAGLSPLHDQMSWQGNTSAESLSPENWTLDLIQDGSFEAYRYPNFQDPYWNQYDSIFGTPLCTYEDCDYWVEAHPYNGYSWAWFGGATLPTHTASVSQAVTFPSCGSGYLEFYFYIGYAGKGSGTNDVFSAKIDGITIFSANASQIKSYPSYVSIKRSVNAFAKGVPHSIEFSHVNTGQDVTFNLDDVSLKWEKCPPIISGNVGAAGANLSYIDGSLKTVTSNTDGSYSLQVSDDWSGYVTPTHPCYTFAPAQLYYSYVLWDQPNQNYNATYNPAAGCVKVDVKIGGDLKGSYGIPPGGRVAPTYPVVNGPVNISSTNTTPVFASERVHNATGFVNEAMGVPNDQLTNEYWFPWYDNQYMQSWILVGNPSTGSDAHVRIYIAGEEQPGSPYTILPGGRITPQYMALNGPVHIVSDINVFTSMRVHTAQGFVNETMGIPNNKLTTQYWFPWYDNQTMTSWILVGNPSTTEVAHVDIYIAGQKQNDKAYEIQPGDRITPTFPVLNGPVKIVSDIDVFTTQRVHNATGFINEAPGIPNNQLNTEYWFPWYDNQYMTSWILVGNPSETETAYVDIYIAGQKQNTVPYEILPGNRITPTYNVLNGPVHIVSNINVFASMRVHTGQGFVNEAAGIPNSQLTTQYWFPWYDNQYMQSWILVGKP